MVCTIQTRPITVSGLTMSFGHTTSTDNPCGTGDDAAFSAFDNRIDTTNSAEASGVANGDEIEISLTLAEAPNTEPVDKATAQKIKVSGMVTVTHDDDGDINTDQATTSTYMISGEITYNRPVTPKP